MASPAPVDSGLRLGRDGRGHAEEMGDKWVTRYGSNSWRSMLVVGGYLPASEVDHFRQRPLSDPPMSPRVILAKAPKQVK